MNQRNKEIRQRIEAYKKSKHTMIRDRDDGAMNMVISYYNKVRTPPDKLQERSKYKRGWKQKSGLSDKQAVKFGVH